MAGWFRLQLASLTGAGAGQKRPVP
jgi:hypothetical protein